MTNDKIDYSCYNDEYAYLEKYSDYKIKAAKINQLAIKYANCPVSDVEAKKSIKMNLMTLQCSALKSKYCQTSGGYVALFPLLRSWNGKIPYDPFCDMFMNTLNEAVSKFDAARNISFSNYFGALINMRVPDVWKKVAKEVAKAGVPTADLPEPPPSPRGESEYSLTLDTMLVSIIKLMKDFEKHVKRQKWMDRFFTFDTAKAVRTDDDYALSTLRVNDIIFPVMDGELLHFLLIGTIAHMRNVISNDLKSADILNSYKTTLSKCFNVSGQTVINKHKFYDNVRNQIRTVVFGKISESI